MLKLLAISLSFFSVSICFNACYEPIVGCLEINSSNYLVSADRPCDSCCVYPSFNITVDQVFNGEDFSLGDTLINLVGDTFQLTDFYLALSRFNLTGEAGEITVNDSTEFVCDGVTTFLPNDIVVITSSTSLVSVGALQSFGGYTNIDFLLGLDDCSHDTGLDYLDDDNELSLLDTLFTDGIGFTTFLVEFNDSLSIELAGTTETISLSQPLLASNAAGNPLVLDMRIDFGVWLSNISLDEGEEAIKAKIIANSSSAISISQ